MHTHSDRFHAGHARRWHIALALLAALLLAGCATGYGNYPGGTTYPGSGAYPGGYGSQRLLATVQGVDVNYGRLLVSVDNRGYSGGQSQVDLYFDRNTQLVYQGRLQSVAGLERGDRISVDAVQSARARSWRSTSCNCASNPGRRPLTLPLSGV